MSNIQVSLNAKINGTKAITSSSCSDYLQIVDTPMDLQTVKEELLSGNYETAADFAKDMRLIFQNSRNYNTNQRSRVSFITNFSKKKIVSCMNINYD